MHASSDAGRLPNLPGRPICIDYNGVAGVCTRGKRLHGQSLKMRAASTTSPDSSLAPCWSTSHRPRLPPLVINIKKVIHPSIDRFQFIVASSGGH